MEQKMSRHELEAKKEYCEKAAKDITDKWGPCCTLSVNITTSDETTEENKPATFINIEYNWDSPHGVSEEDVHNFILALNKLIGTINKYFEGYDLNQPIEII